MSFNQWRKFAKRCAQEGWLRVEERLRLWISVYPALSKRPLRQSMQAPHQLARPWLGKSIIMRNFSQKGQGQPAQKEKNGQKLESTVPYDKPTPALHIIWQNLTITTIRCRVKLDINTWNKEQHTRQGNTQMRHFSFILFKWYIKVLQANTCTHEQKAMVKQNPMTLAMRQEKTTVALDFSSF